MTYEDFRKEWLDDGDTIAVKTSGSTGTPKRIVLTKDFVAESARRTIGFFGIDSKSILHSCISPDTIGGKMVLVRAILAGCQFSHETPTNRPAFPSSGDAQITLASVVASQMLHVVTSPSLFRHVKTFLLGGSPVDIRLRSMIAGSGLDVYESYGMTETASHIALRHIDSPQPAPFIPLPGITTEADSRGCLVITFPDGTSIATNDLAEVYPDGSFNITGRLDHMIITGGKKVNPTQLEKELSQFTDFPFIITSRPDIKWGHHIVMIVETGGRHFDEIGFLKAAGEMLPHHMLPKEMIYVEKLPQLPGGKLDRRPLEQEQP